jgi:hypothetical protein
VMALLLCWLKDYRLWTDNKNRRHLFEVIEVWMIAGPQVL